MTEKKQLTNEEQQAWIREQYLVATKYLADKGLVTDSVVTQESRYLVPLLAVWKLKLLDGSFVWTISGDLPSDHIKGEIAETGRDSLRHFALKWQLQAENLLQDKGNTQETFANLLISRSEGLYELYENENLWK